jgi:Transcriptional regulatory protein, C terminal
MKKNIFMLAIPLVLGGVGLAFLTGETPSVKADDSQKINLALRQTAHRLLQQAGDSTSRIAPIEATSDHSFVVKMENAFSYDSLPVFLHKSLSQYGILTPYTVAVWDCDYSNLVLGYASFDVSENKNVPCSGRNQEGNCLNFTVTFAEKTSIFTQNMMAKWVFSGLFALITAALFYYVSNRKKIVTPNEQLLSVDDTHIITIGKTYFDTRQQALIFNNNVQKLSEREAKLFEFFCQHPNELLDRDVILKEIWQDEGVLVTRTVDVYVSRLRKLLKSDDTLKIANVHGRGYKLEIADA